MSLHATRSLRSFAVVIAAASIAASALAQDVDALIKRLGEADQKVRAEAAAKLKDNGLSVLPKLREALAAPATEPAKSEIEGLIRGLEAKAADALTIEVELPKGEPTLAEINSHKWRVVVRLSNHGDGDLTFFRYATLTVLDKDGKPVKPARAIGRFGRRKPGCLLEELKFITLSPGQSVELNDSLAKWDYDLETLLGWKLEAPGEYTLRIDYVFSRKDLVARCKEEACTAHGKPASPWNAAVEVTKTFSKPVTVKE